MNPIRVSSLMRVPVLLGLLIVLGLQPAVSQQKKDDKKKAEEVKLTAAGGMFPPGAKAGSTVSVTISGERLTGAKGFWCEHPGITAKIKGEGASDTQVQADLTVAGDVPPGLYQWRLLADRGASPPRFLAVSGGDSQIEKEPNDAIEQAQPLGMEGAVAGNLEKYQDIDLYKITGKSGERVLIVAQAQALGVSAELAVAVIDRQGRPVALGKEFLQGDPFIDFTFPADGDFWVQVWNLTPGDQPGRVYRLTVTKLPILQYVFPPGGQRGKSVNLQVGAIDPAGSLGGKPDGNFQVVTVPLAIPADAPAEFSLRLPGKRSLNSLPLAIGDLPEINEIDPNDDPKAAQVVTPPVIINGRFPNRGDVDYYKLKATKGQKLVLDVEAQQLGYRGDLVVTIFDAAGKQLAENNDRTPAELDPRLEFTAPDDDEYLVRIQEVVPRRCNGPKFVYRLAIREPLPDFLLTVNEPTLWMKPGEGIVSIDIARIDGFNAELTAVILGLPPDVKAEPAVISPGQPRAVIPVIVPPARNNQHFPITIVGKAQVGDRMLVRQATAQVPLVMSGNAVKSSFATEKLFLTITDRDLGPPPPPPPPVGAGILAASTAGWKYIAASAVKGNDWIKPDFKDNNWKGAKAPIGYGEDAVNEKKGTTLELTGQNVYFRREFTLDAKVLKPGTTFKLLVASDNSAVVYINGKQVDNDNADHEPMYWNRTVDVPANVFVMGRNVVAVQLINSQGSSDAFLDLQIDAAVPTTAKK